MLGKLVKKTKKILEHFTISNFKLVIKSLIFRFISMWCCYHNQPCKRLDDSKPHS